VCTNSGSGKNPWGGPSANVCKNHRVVNPGRYAEILGVTNLGRCAKILSIKNLGGNKGRNAKNHV